MKQIDDENLFLRLSESIEDERNCKFNKARRNIKSYKIEIENELRTRGYEDWQIEEKLNSIIDTEDIIEENDWQMPTRSNLRSRIMYIENKSTGLEGDARIGRIYFSKSGKSVYYDGKRFQSLKGSGFKSNYFDVDSGDEYWISGPRKDRSDRLYSGSKDVQIDDDVREEYFLYLNG